MECKLYYSLSQITEEIKVKNGIKRFFPPETFQKFSYLQKEIAGDFASAISFLAANGAITQEHASKLMCMMPCVDKDLVDEEVKR